MITLWLFLRRRIASPETHHPLALPETLAFLENMPGIVLQSNFYNLDFISLSNVMAVKGKSSIDDMTEIAALVFRHKLIPRHGDLAWFATSDAAHVFQHPTKIRRFFEVLRFLYPSFDESYNAVRNGAGMISEPRMAEFIEKLTAHASTSYMHLFDAEPEKHPNWKPRNSDISVLEKIISRTVWQKFDAPTSNMMRDPALENVATSLYIKFDAPIRAEHRKDVQAVIDWDIIGREHSDVVPMNFAASRIDIGMRDAYELEGGTHKFLTGVYRSEELPQSWFRPNP